MDRKKGPKEEITPTPRKQKIFTIVIPSIFIFKRKFPQKGPQSTHK